MVHSSCGWSLVQLLENFEKNSLGRWVNERNDIVRLVKGRFKWHKQTCFLIYKFNFFFLKIEGLRKLNQIWL